jgi:glycerol-3-phosphate acyltransferase PlsY
MRGYNLAMGRNRNVIRAVGMGAGLATTLLDLVKGALPIWMVKLILPDSPWAKVELQVEP